MDVNTILPQYFRDNAEYRSWLTMQQQHITGLHGGFLTLFLRTLYQKSKSLIMIVPQETDALTLQNDLETLGLPSYIFPSIQHNIYSPSHVHGLRASHLLQLHTNIGTVHIIPARALFRLYAPVSELLNQIISLAVGMTREPSLIAQALTHMGYERVTQVNLPGEFVLRGEVIDIYMHGHDYPWRLQFDFDTISLIREFDPNNQMSFQTLQSIDIYPIKESAFSEEQLQYLHESWQKRAEFRGQMPPISNLATTLHYHDLFLPLLFDKPVFLTDYFPSESQVVVIDYERVVQVEQTLWREVEGLYKQAIRQGVAVPTPSEILVKLDQLPLESQKSIYTHQYIDSKTVAFQFKAQESRSFFGNINLLKDELHLWRQNGYQIFIFTESEQQALRFSQLLQDYPEIYMINRSLSSGFILPKEKIVVLCEHEIFGRKKRQDQSKNPVKTQAIDSFIDLSPSDYVVHIHHGIGQFKGIDRMRVGGQERDYITLEYADNDLVYIPIEQVNLVQRYIGNEGSAPRLDKIGGKGWNSKKTVARKSAEELADYLLKLYAEREMAQGFAFPPDDTFQLEFEADFPYQETQDQLHAIEEIKADMEKPKPMDRLLCGDVGYGKTELAMRATFKAVMAGKQAAVLCPTTILAEQHYENFIKRFERFSFIRIALISRFVDTKTQNEIIKKLALGEVDLLIGTHRLLSKDITFRDLGLLVVDEEQRFGVKDKEKIKKLCVGIDTLTMSATPIPRTLHMSLVQLRDLSTLKTPPSNRRPVETYVEEYNIEGVQAAIRNELTRNGQVFYLHNRVESLEATSQFIANLVPEAMVEMAHGQMGAHELDDIMHRFIHGGFQVLVSTTIIESGIDIPNVNTIIIDRADMYGIGQLYQLRGRVGRSDRLAHAYLFYPEKAALSELAMKRLQIISDFTDLGSGFKIAMKDMEIRGAGNLLGREQSGQIQAIGFDLYLKMLDEAIKKRKNHDDDITFEPYLELDYTGFIPDDYVDNVMEKMEIYKKIASVIDGQEAGTLLNELNDRFGPPPDEVFSLLELAELKILCRKLKIISIKERQEKAEIEFARVAELSVENIMRLITESGGKIRPHPQSPASLIIETGRIGLKEKSEYLKNVLQRII
jgi:transcription-repair coupling factor (superfamily II helicase)